MALVALDVAATMEVPTGGCETMPEEEPHDQMETWQSPNKARFRAWSCSVNTSAPNFDRGPVGAPLGPVLQL